MGIWYSKDTGMSMTAYVDADHVGCQDTKRSTSGSAQFLGDKLVSWSSKNQKSTMISSTEAEFMSICKAFGGNTRDLGSFGEETDKLLTYTIISPEFLLIKKEDVATDYTLSCRHHPSKTRPQDLQTASEDENPIRTLGDYSKPSHKSYRNTIELPVGNNVVPLRSDNIRLVQNGCSFHRLRSEDPNQHLKDFVKLVDSLDLDGDNRERTHLRLFKFPLCDQASSWLERLPAGSITTWEDLTTRFLA
ncbi:hypothetical protein Tco_1402858 [Tanacetum coccineum]